MQLVSTITEMCSISEGARSAGQTIALVPTMGYFHDGHLSLMREGRRRGDVLVVSLFVNPAQFGEGEDYGAYPRDFSRDKRMAERIGVDILFAPTVEEMYPKRFQTFVAVFAFTLGFVMCICALVLNSLSDLLRGIRGYLARPGIACPVEGNQEITTIRMEDISSQDLNN